MTQEKQTGADKTTVLLGARQRYPKHNPRGRVIRQAKRPVNVQTGYLRVRQKSENRINRK